MFPVVDRNNEHNKASSISMTTCMVQYLIVYRSQNNSWQTEVLFISQSSAIRLINLSSDSSFTLTNLNLNSLSILILLIKYFCSTFTYLENNYPM